MVCRLPERSIQVGEERPMGNQAQAENPVQGGWVRSAKGRGGGGVGRNRMPSAGHSCPQGLVEEAGDSLMYTHFCIDNALV